MSRARHARRWQQALREAVTALAWWATAVLTIAVGVSLGILIAARVL